MELKLGQNQKERGSVGSAWSKVWNSLLAKLAEEKGRQRRRRRKRKRERGKGRKGGKRREEEFSLETTKPSSSILS